MEEVPAGVLAESYLGQSLLLLQVQAYTTTEPRSSKLHCQLPTLVEDKDECVQLIDTKLAGMSMYDSKTELMVFCRTYDSGFHNVRNSKFP